MNIKNSTSYSIGLDIGTASVGWSVTDEATGELLYYSGKPCWGSRLFTEGKKAADRRVARGMRRRYDRRRFRLSLLDDMFAEEIAKVDPNFLARMKMSRLFAEDRPEGYQDLKYPLFNDKDFTDKDYYKKYPHIYALRNELIQNDEQADIRLVYLAMHHIVKYRGNFIREDEVISSKNSNIEDTFDRLNEAWLRFCEERFEDDYFNTPELFDLKESGFFEILMSEKRITDRKADVKEIPTANKDVKAALVELLGFVSGYKLNPTKIFFVESSSFKATDEASVESFPDMLSEYEAELFAAMQTTYSAYVMQGLLSYAAGTLSANKCAEYEKHKKELTALKELADYKHKLAGGEGHSTLYKKIFYKGRMKNSYAAYIDRLCSQEDFEKNIRALMQTEFEDILNEDARVNELYYFLFTQEAGEGALLKRLRTSDNVNIPYQLHYEELEMILENQAQYYPFLQENKDKILSLVKFRIPYYVGPLITKVEGNKRSEYSWLVRKEGMENEKIYPWNLDEIVDKNETAKAFMNNLIGCCTYLPNEKVLPRRSLVYEEFCVLNELNGIKWFRDGDRPVRFTADQRRRIMDDLFRKRKTVNARALEEWLKKQGYTNTRVEGFQDEGKFASQLATYIDYKKILGVELMSCEQEVMVERLATIATVYEDQKIRKELIRKEFGDVLTPEQIKKAARIHYTGWGNLSKKLLVDMKSDSNEGQVSIMDILRDGNPNADHKGHTMLFMEIINDSNLEFEEKINEYRSKLDTLKVDDLPLSPGIRRAVVQTLKIVEEIIDIAGGNIPTKINVEVAREEGEKTRTTNRKNEVKNALDNLAKESKQCLSELKDFKSLNDRQYLYFMQNGHCAYCGKPLDITNLQNYDIDHVLPQFFVKDDSLENRVLCCKSCNERKLDDLLLEKSIIDRMKPTWTAWKNAGMMGAKKYRNLTRTSLSENDKNKFINRQLVDTRQAMKYVSLILSNRYNNVRVVPIKAALSSDLRKALDLPKSRLCNDYHHAHDAFIASQISRFLDVRYPALNEDGRIMAECVSKYFNAALEEAAEKGKLYKRKSTSAFFITSFMKSGFDKETAEILRDTWDAERAISYIKKALQFNTCHVTKRLEEKHAELWKQTIYSPDPKKRKEKGQSKTPTIMLKRAGNVNEYEGSLEVEKYGGLATMEMTHYFLWSSEKKNGKVEINFDGYPLYHSMASGDVEAYMYELAEAKGKLNPKLLVGKILTNQKIAVGKDEYRICAMDALRCAKQIHLSPESYRTIAYMDSDNPYAASKFTEEDLKNLYVELANKAEILCSYKLKEANKLVDGIDVFDSLDFKDKVTLISSICNYYTGSFARLNLKPLGGGEHAAPIKISPIKELDSSGDCLVVEFIHESITGMRAERRKVVL